MVHSIPQYSKVLFPEVAIADFTRFQIAVLTTTQRINRKFSQPKSLFLKGSIRLKGG
ncbi:MAG: hypothetical protein AAGA75_07230 [Cyanobacteria bacterium P01_E01_bin.6]